MPGGKEKTTKHSIFKRLVAGFACMAVLLASFGNSASAATSTSNVDSTYYPAVFDETNNGWGRNAIKVMNGWNIGALDYLPVYMVEGKAAYCIEFGIPFFDSSGGAVMTRDENYWNDYPDSLNQTISAEIMRSLMGRIMTFGYQGEVPVHPTWEYCTLSEDNACKWFATQLLVWETLVGERDENFRHIDPPTGVNKVWDMVKSNHPKLSTVRSYYDSIVSSVQNQAVTPSFMRKGAAETVTLTWNGSRYETKLTDANGVLGNYTIITNNTAVKTTKSGNTLTVYSAAPVTSPVTITATKTGTSRVGVVVWTDGRVGISHDGMQDMITYSQTIEDPVVAKLKAETPEGTIKITKATDNGMTKEGWKFKIAADDGAKLLDGTTSATVTTDSNGTATLKVPAGHTYTVTEIGNDAIASTAYTATAKNVSVSVASGKTVTAAFTNKVNTGTVKITKKLDLPDGVTAEAYDMTRFSFTLSGTSAVGAAVSLTAKCNADGIATFSNVPVGTYTVTEKSLTNWNVVSSKEVTVTNGTTKNVTFTNTPKTGTVKLTKSISLPEGADGSNIDFTKFSFTLTGTSSSGLAVSMTKACSSDKTVTFTNVPAGTYTITETDASGWTIEASKEVTVTDDKSTAVSFTNTIKAGMLVIQKTVEDGLPQGMKFQVTGSNTATGVSFFGTYETDANGKITISDLPAGTYTLSCL